MTTPSRNLSAAAKAQTTKAAQSFTKRQPNGGPKVKHDRQTQQRPKSPRGK